jgi:addiction module HigA family antidote
VIPTHRIPTHPGRILSEEFLEPLGITRAALARHLGISLKRVEETVRGKRAVTAETAWLLAGAFGTTPEFWLHLQNQHALAASRPARATRRIRIGRGA